MKRVKEKKESSGSGERHAERETQREGGMGREEGSDDVHYYCIKQH